MKKGTASASLRFSTPFSFEKSMHILDHLTSELWSRAYGPEYDTSRSPVGSDIRGAVDRYRALPDIDYRALNATLDSLRCQRQIQAFFSKNASIPLGIDTREVAVAKFFESEDQCRLTNRRFLLRSNPIKSGLDAGFLYGVQRKIAWLLGDVPSLDELDFGFGPGANVGISRKTSVRRKLSVDPTVTAGASKYVPYLQAQFPTWSSLERATIKDYGKLATVPKNAKTDRCIMVEPIINTFLQKGVGRWIRNRLLRKAGVDLRDQSRNQMLAREGSITGDLATLDLSSASDTISRELVASLLPYPWWVLLEDLRTDVILHEGEKHVLAKFSSMGNGFTFELESLIFYAIARTACETGIVSVYGDDIIVPSCYALDVIERLEMCGFSINTEKSFFQGPFRESCGGDFFEGFDIRPVYVAGLLSVRELYRLHNFFYRRGENSLASILIGYIPSKFRHFGPEGFGDGHLLGDHFRARPKERTWGGYRFKTYRACPEVTKDELPSDYAAFLYFLNGGQSILREKYSSWDDYLHGREMVASEVLYFERSLEPRYRLEHQYTLG
jgi:hypothetical protein